MVYKLKHEEIIKQSSDSKPDINRYLQFIKVKHVVENIKNLSQKW